jgi:hypothetical protein
MSELPVREPSSLEVCCHDRFSWPPVAAIWRLWAVSPRQSSKVARYHGSHLVRPSPRWNPSAHVRLAYLRSPGSPDALPSTNIRLPEGAARKVSVAPCRSASLHPDTYAASGPGQEPGRILIPGDGAAGDQGAQNRPACPAMAATRRLRAVPSQRLPGAMVSGAHAVL